MKVLYLIYSTGKASGGHYHSCDQISRSLDGEINIKIISVGSNPSPVLERNPYFGGHLVFNQFQDAVRMNRSFKKIVSDFKPDLVHCYDAESMNIVLPLPALWSKKFILTKCGGPSPRRDKWQFANAIINFSYENHIWFKNNKYYKDINLYHLANRVGNISVYPVGQRKEKKEKNVFSFVRISRIGGAYDKTLKDTLNLIDQLKDKFKVKLYLIGRVQDEQKFLKIKQNIKKKELPVFFITDSRASKASDFLYLADSVIGTGRSFMEATSLGLPTLTPASNSDLPILVHKENFIDFFKTNFSERNSAADPTLKNNKDLIEKLIADEKYYKQISAESFELFQENFSTKNLEHVYKHIYSLASNDERINKSKLIFMNMAYLLKDWFFKN